jgi:hypothetical protein
MADSAIVTMEATVLPDEIVKVISGSLTVIPADSGDKWYYKISRVANSSSVLMNGSYIGRTGNTTTPVADETAMDATATGDKIKFLFVKNTHASADIYICISASTTAASASNAGNIKVSAGNCVALESPNTTLANIAAISSTGDVDCIVAALLDDVA